MVFLNGTGIESDLMLYQIENWLYLRKIKSKPFHASPTLKNEAEIIIHHSIFIIYLHSRDKLKITVDLKQILILWKCHQTMSTLLRIFGLNGPRHNKKLCGFKVVTVNRLLSWHWEKWGSSASDPPLHWLILVFRFVLWPTDWKWKPGKMERD